MHEDRTGTCPIVMHSFPNSMYFVPVLAILLTTVCYNVNVMCELRAERTSMDLDDDITVRDTGW